MIKNNTNCKTKQNKTKQKCYYLLYMKLFNQPFLLNKELLLIWV